MQEKICNHLVKIKNEPKNDVLIGDEVLKSNDSSRYFKISYSEIRTDQLFVQVTPMDCPREGYLKIDQHGTISLTDNKFNFYRSSRIFYFDPQENILKSREDAKLETQERLSSTCVKGLFSLSLFALGAAVIYNAAVNTDIEFKL